MLKNFTFNIKVIGCMSVFVCVAEASRGVTAINVNIFINYQTETKSIFQFTVGQRQDKSEVLIFG